MKTKKILSLVAGLSLGAGLAAAPLHAAGAQELGTLSYYPVSEAVRQSPGQEWRVFMEYSLQREPCQNYQPPPAGYRLQGCRLVRQQQAALSDIQPAAGEARKVAPAPSLYTVYFDFDRAALRESEQATLGHAARAISEAAPAEVTVAGHADRAGPEDYNQRLSERRAQAVVEALGARGVKAVMVEEAYGETRPAVATPDGVPLQANRRVVIEFRQ